MKARRMLQLAVTVAATGLVAQEPSILDMQGIRQALAVEKEKSAVPDSTPKALDAEKVAQDKKGGRSSGGDEAVLKETERLRAIRELKELRAKDAYPPRFAADLFDTREEMEDATEGGIAEDYVLGVGDHLQITGFGSATFEVPAPVSGNGEVIIPKVGTIKVSGLRLGQAKAAIERKVAQSLAGTRVEVSVVKLREIRVFVLGEVYKPGSYLVPSLSSLVNVLSMAGGPNALGSFRQIRVLRGGQLVHQVDLYPLRASGLGNMNFSLQSGDTVFVPLAFNPVLLQGAFTRIKDTRAAARPEGLEDDQVSDPNADPKEREGKEREAKDTKKPARIREERNQTEPEERDERWKDMFPALTQNIRGRASADDSVPCMRFEVLPGETAKDALAFAGGLAPKAFTDGLSLRRADAQGVTMVQEIALADLGTVPLRRGDVLSALPRRDRVGQTVEIRGWVRVAGTFGRTEGLRVGDLLKRQGQILPDTYLGRGEILRTNPDGSTRYLAFEVSKALAGDATDNLLLEDRDQVTLYQVERMRPRKVVTLSGPFTKAGAFEFHQGMRVADLIFKAGIPEKSANLMVAELARFRNGQPSEVRRLDLGKLLSNDTSSPVALTDDTVNPLLQDEDRVSIYAKPEFKVHRVVQIQGQVANPGAYVLDRDHASLSQLIERAGGLTPVSMPSAGLLFRQMPGLHYEGINFAPGGQSGIAEILDRLNETKIFDLKGVSQAQVRTGVPEIFKLPVLHGLEAIKLNRVVVDFEAALAHKQEADLELQDGDTVIIPRKTETAMVIGEAATPFAYYKATPGLTVGKLLDLAGGLTRNADAGNIRLLKANGRIVDSWVRHRAVEPGDSVLIPQVIRRDTNWQESLTALTPLAILINAVRR